MIKKSTAFIEVVIPVVNEVESSAEMLTGFDRTGLLRMWDSELVMAYYCSQVPQLFTGKRVCELGAGRFCLASLVLLHSLWFSLVFIVGVAGSYILFLFFIVYSLSLLR